MDQQFWDGRYGERERLWSGRPNGALVAEVADLPPGQALDAGCGEGADALWLAARGWLVTAVDISLVALTRAAAVAGDAKVSWTHADLTRSAWPAGAFDLVSAIFFPVPHEPDHRALHGLLAAVAPGGTLLFVGHDLSGYAHHDPRVDPADYYTPAEVAEVLDEGWTVRTLETRPRSPLPPDAIHTHDVVLRAVRR